MKVQSQTKEPTKKIEPKRVYVTPEEAPNLQRLYELVKKRSGGVVKVTVTREP